MTQASGYSGTPLPKKLGIKPGHTVLFADAPDGFDPQPMPDGVTVDEVKSDEVQGEEVRGDEMRGEKTTADGTAVEGPYDVVLTFTPDRAALTRNLADLPPILARDGALWICWPKKSSGVVTDLSDDVVRADALALPIGLVDVKVAAIDATWSGLKLVYRLTAR